MVTPATAVTTNGAVIASTRMSAATTRPAADSRGSFGDRQSRDPPERRTDFPSGSSTSRGYAG